MPNLLPSIIPPESIPWVTTDGRLTHTAWLLIYNIVQKVLGTDGSSTAAYIAGVNADLLTTVETTPVPAASYAVPLLPDAVVMALIQRALLQDVPSQAAPAQTITPGGSPWVYTALQAGSLILSGGTVSAVAIGRAGTFYATGQTAGEFTLSRLDQLRVTYSVTPTATFLPR